MPDCIVLDVPRQVYVAGGSVQGTVQLHFPLIQDQQIEEVHVKLRGSAYTWVRLGRSSEFQTVPLVRENISVWQRGSAYPAPGSHDLRIPFQFTLPRSLPPSFEFTCVQGRGNVRYYVEAVGVRTGAFRMNKRTIRPLAVVPHDSGGAQTRDAMKFGWCGRWSSVVTSNRIRKGLWGDHSDVCIEFVRPAVDCLPLFLPIPFTISITTVSKPVKQGDCRPSESVWPAPPLHAKDVTFELKRNVYISTGAYSEQDIQIVRLHGGLDGSCTVQTETTEAEWVPLSGDGARGRWKQKVTFASSFVLRCPPTFKSTTIKNEYFMHLQVYFGSPFHSVKANIPITISSGMVPSTVLEYYAPGDTSAADFMDPAGTSPRTNEEVDYTQPPPELDLPPSYWSTSHWEDHKD